METLIFGLHGQSNAVGKSANPQTLAPINENSLVFGNDYRLKIIDPSVFLDDPANQVDQCSLDLSPGYSLAIPFCNKLQTLYANSGGVRIIIAPCAKGGSTWADWSKDAIFENGQNLYWSMFQRMRAVWRPGYRYAGILTLLGESDAQTQLTSQSWSENMLNFVSQFRTDMGNIVIPHLFAQLHHMAIDGELPFADIVRIEQTSTDGALSKLKMVIPFETNYLHYSTYNTTLMGNSMANIWYNNFK